MNSVLGRSVSADLIRNIWATLKLCQTSGVSTTHATLVSHVAQNCVLPIEESELRVQQCIEAGVLQKKIDPNIGQEVLCVPDEAHNLFITDSVQKRSKMALFTDLSVEKHI